MTPLRPEDLAAHPFLAGMSPEHVALIAERALEVDFTAGQRIFDEGENADRCWLLWDGRVTLDLHVPGRGTLLVESLGRGDVLGWSWLFPPYSWRFGAVAVEATRAVEIDAPALRKLCDRDTAFCKAMYVRFSMVAIDRLQATRLRLLDMYAGHVNPGHLNPGHLNPGHLNPGHLNPGHLNPGHGHAGVGGAS